MPFFADFYRIFNGMLSPTSVYGSVKLLDMSRTHKVVHVCKISEKMIKKSLKNFANPELRGDVSTQSKRRPRGLTGHFPTQNLT